MGEAVSNRGMQCVGCGGGGGAAAGWGSGVFLTAGDQDYDNNISSGTATFPLLSQADHISRMPHAAGGLPHGHTRLPSEIRKL